MRSARSKLPPYIFIHSQEQTSKTSGAFFHQSPVKREPISDRLRRSVGTDLYQWRTKTHSCRCLIHHLFFFLIFNFPSFVSNTVCQWRIDGALYQTTGMLPSKLKNGNVDVLWMFLNAFIIWMNVGFLRVKYVPVRNRRKRRWSFQHRVHTDVKTGDRDWERGVRWGTHYSERLTFSMIHVFNVIWRPSNLSNGSPTPPHSHTKRKYRLTVIIFTRIQNDALYNF